MIYIFSKIKCFHYILNLSQVSIDYWFSKHNFVRKIARLVVKNAEGIIFVTEKAKKRLLKIGYLKKSDNIPSIILGHPINTKFFKPLSKKKINTFIEQINIKVENILLFVGSIIPKKGLDVLINALAIVKGKKIDFKLLIIGKTLDKNYRKKLSKMVKNNELENNLIWMEYVPRSELVKYYNISKVLILPSVLKKEIPEEQFGIVLIEAMACEKPVICSNLGGMSEIVKHNKIGFLFPPNNPKKLAFYIEKILKNEHLIKKFGQKGRNYVLNNFEKKKYTKAYFNFYKKIIDRVF